MGLRKRKREVENIEHLSSYLEKHGGRVDGSFPVYFFIGRQKVGKLGYLPGIFSLEPVQDPESDNTQIEFKTYDGEELETVCVVNEEDFARGVLKVISRHNITS